jgi:hypothetical protein
MNECLVGFSLLNAVTVSQTLLCGNDAVLFFSNPSFTVARQSNNDLPPSFSLYVFHLSVLKARGIGENERTNRNICTSHPDHLIAK